MAELTDRHRQFCWHVLSGRSPKEAGMLLGLHPTTGNTLMHKPHIQAYLAELRRKAEEKLLDKTVQQAAVNLAVGQLAGRAPRNVDLLAQISEDMDEETRNRLASIFKQLDLTPGLVKQAIMQQAMIINLDGSLVDNIVRVREALALEGEVKMEDGVIVHVSKETGDGRPDRDNAPGDAPTSAPA